MTQTKLTPRNENFSEWYNQVILKAELADYAPVRGCMVVRPYGWALWENIQQALDRRFKETGHSNAAFPMLIPKSFMEKEKEHVEGFSPELAVVTIGGGQVLEEPLIIRPTSETIIGHMYAKWIQSYRDLPVLINQWGSVVRWEMRTRLFLRTMEFYWQEGHTAHATHEEGIAETIQMLNIYADFAITDGAVPVFEGRKSQSEKFAGALNSYSIEAMMGDTKALQAGTSHDLGQNFAKAFEIQYLNQNNELEHVWTTSWGLSTRFIGAIIMTHGDDQGLVLPPRLAPIQVIIIPIYRNPDEKTAVSAAVDQLRAQLTGIRYKVDDREGVTPGYKFNDWEMRGVPLRIEIGPKDVEKGVITTARRDLPGKQGKAMLPLMDAGSQVKEALEVIQKAMLEKATRFRDENIHDPKNYEELQAVVQNGWAFSWWCGDPVCEAKIKDDTKATTRNIPLNQEGTGKCIVCGKPAVEKAYISKAY
jgi:prolyl-tRNA synthetase